MLHHLTSQVCTVSYHPMFIYAVGKLCKLHTRIKMWSAATAAVLTKLCIPIVIIASDSLLKVAQADGQVARSAQVNYEMAPAFARRPCMVIVVIICRLHLCDTCTLTSVAGTFNACSLTHAGKPVCGDCTYKVWVLRTATGITLSVLKPRYRAYLHSDGSLARTSLAKEYICSLCNNSLLLVGRQNAAWAWTAPCGT